MSKPTRDDVDAALLAAIAACERLVAVAEAAGDEHLSIMAKPAVSVLRRQMVKREEAQPACAAIEPEPVGLAGTIVESGPFCDWETCGAPLDGPARPGCGSQYIHDGRYKSHPAWVDALKEKR